LEIEHIFGWFLIDVCHGGCINIKKLPFNYSKICVGLQGESLCI